MFPRHEASLTLTHNPHRDYYETVEQYSENPWMEESWIDGEKDKAIATKEIWTLQWYPDTPVGSYHIAGSTLDVVLKRAKEIQENEDSD